MESVYAKARSAPLEVVAQRTVVDRLLTDTANIVADEFLAGDRLQDFCQDRQAVLCATRLSSVAMHI